MKRKALDDEFKVYIDQGVVQHKIPNLLTWWSQSSFLKLAQMAINLISVSAMSAEVERIFSSAKRLLAPDRHRLTPETLEIFELLRNWWLDEEGLPTETDDDIAANCAVAARSFAATTRSSCAVGNAATNHAHWTACWGQRLAAHSFPILTS